jgi:hypothetical protein
MLTARLLHKRKSLGTNTQFFLQNFSNRLRKKRQQALTPQGRKNQELEINMLLI